MLQASRILQARLARGLSAAILAFGLALPVGAAPGVDYIAPRKPIAAPQGFAGVCERYSWACARSGSKRLTADFLGLADGVNRKINARVRQVSDRSQYGREEVWALPTGRGGDCEDFALLKKRELIQMGVPANRLLIATVLDRNRSPHAVLVVRTAAGDYVLDNLTNRIRGWRQTGYTFLRMQNPSSPGHWDAIFAGGIFDQARS